MSIEDLFHDYGVETAPEGHKHHRPGWVNVDCPFCVHNPGYHLGFNEDGKYFYCWSCGKDNAWSIKKTLSTLLHISESEASRLAKEYNIFRGKRRIEKPKIKVNHKPFKFPSDTGPMKRNHKKYLEKRGFDPDYLEKEWGVLGTGPASYLDNVDYSHRLLTPIYWEGRIVSFQTRDITDKQSPKYKTCPEEREKVHHKHILYRSPNLIYWKRETGICVEGKFDVWRFGPIGFATFGIEYMPEQVWVMAKLFKRIFTAFDPEPQAQKKAEDMRGELRFRGVECHNIDLLSDPGALPQKEANYIVKQIMKGKL